MWSQVVEVFVRTWAINYVDLPLEWDGESWRVLYEGGMWSDYAENGLPLHLHWTFPVPVKVKGREWEQGRQLRSCCFHRDKSWRLLRSGWWQWRPHEVTVGLYLKVGFCWLVGCEMWVRSRRALRFLTPVTGRGELPFPELKKTTEEQVWDGEKVSYVQKWACRAEVWLQIVLEVGRLSVVF